MSDSIFAEIKKFQAEIAPPQTIVVENDVLSENFSFGNNIYTLFTALHSLFKELDLLSDSPKDNKNKFRFIHSFPDSVKDDGSNVVTYNIVKRNPRVTQNYSVNTRSVTKNKATSVGESYNTVTGSVEEFYKLEFDNVISITIFSKKARVLNNLARVIESIFLKYSSFIKQFVDESLYLGMSDIRFLDRYDEQEPIYARELQFKVLTTEVYKQELEQAKSIDIQLK